MLDKIILVDEATREYIEAQEFIALVLSGCIPQVETQAYDSVMQDFDAALKIVYPDND